MHWGFVVSGFAILLLDAYWDSVRGPLMPVIARVLALPYTETSLFMVLGNITAIFATVALIPLLARFGEKRVTMATCFLAVATALFSLWVSSFIFLAVLAVMLGVVLAFSGALCNVLVIQGTSLERRARIFCGLHFMYGFGSLFAPLALQFFLSREFHWPVVIAAATPLFAALFFYVGIAVPEVSPVAVQESPSSRLTRLQGLILLTFCIYVAGEVITSVWMVTYLVEARHFSVEAASPYLAGFFVMMCASRGLCFLSLKPTLEVWVISFSLILGSVFFALGLWGHCWAFSLVGIIGPFYPLVLARVTRSFPQQARALTLWILSSVQLTLGAAHMTIGRLTDMIGIETSYRVPFLLFLAALCGFLAYLQWERGRVSRRLSTVSV
jgi:MFS family permease